MTPIHRKHQQRPAAQLAGQQHCQDEAQVARKSGDPAFRAAKHKQFWLRQDGPPQLQVCLTAALQRRACSCFGQAPAARRCPKLLEKGQARSGCLRPQAQIQGPKKRAVSRPQKWGREMDPAPAIQFGTRLGGVKLRPQNWGRLAAPNLGPRILLFLGLSRLLHSGDSGPQTSPQRGKSNYTENHDLRRQLSCGSDQHERNLHRGGPHTRSQNCLDFSTPDLEVTESQLQASRAHCLLLLLSDTLPANSHVLFPQLYPCPLARRH